VKSIALAAAALLATAFAAAPAQADEIVGGLYVHDVDTILTIAGVEKGADVQIGWRGERIGKTPLQPYAFAALNTSGNTNYGAFGISAKFGDKLYVRPGLGLAVHTGSSGNFQRTDKIAFGSRILFAPELGIGAQVNERVSVEASWVHMSHAQLFGRQNPGIDNVGVRVNFAF
jgi:hypothetical protein